MPDPGALAAAVRIIERFEPRCEAQRGAREQILAFCGEHPDALYRTCGPGHLTASALILDAAGSRALLMLHRKLGIWVQMGGHVDGEHDLARAGLREATEESGITGLVVDADPIDLDVHTVRPPGDPVHLHLDVRFVARAPAGAIARPNHESVALRWVTPGELEGLEVDAGLRRLASIAFDASRTA